MQASKKRDEVGVLSKSMNILVCLAESKLSVVELYNLTGISKPTIYRILNTFESEGFVTREQVKRKYILGPALIGLGRATRNSTELIRAVRPALRELREKYNETINLGVLSQGKVIYLDTLESAQPIRVTVPISNEANCHTTALGKAILSALPEVEALKIIAELKLPIRTTNTIHSQEQFLKAIRKTRTLGYAIDNEEDEIGSRCVSAPILDALGFPVGAISLTASTSRATLQDFAKIGNHLISVCLDIKKTIPIHL